MLVLLFFNFRFFLFRFIQHSREQTAHISRSSTGTSTSTKIRHNRMEIRLSFYLSISFLPSQSHLQISPEIHNRTYIYEESQEGTPLFIFFLLFYSTLLNSILLLFLRFLSLLLQNTPLRGTKKHGMFITDFRRDNLPHVLPFFASEEKGTSSSLLGFLDDAFTQVEEVTSSFWNRRGKQEEVVVKFVPHRTGWIKNGNTFFSNFF